MWEENLARLFASKLRDMKIRCTQRKCVTRFLIDRLFLIVTSNVKFFGDNHTILFSHHCTSSNSLEIVRNI